MIFLILLSTRSFRTGPGYTIRYPWLPDHFIPISRAELAMTGIEESSCRSAPFTDVRPPGMTRQEFGAGENYGRNQITYKVQEGYLW